jgi:hypothetical protein
MSCHRQGGIGAFSMESPDTVIPNAAQIAADVTSRKMPPWPVDESCGGPYAGSLHLSDAEISTITTWASQGAAVGEASDAPAPYQPPAALASVEFMGAPVNPYTPPDGVTDDYHCFVIDPQLANNVNVIGYEIDPGISAEVHHVALYMVDRAQAAAKNVAGAGWTCFGGTNTADQNLLGAWAPGSRAVSFPQGTGIELQSSKVIVMQVHYNLQNGVRTADATTMKLQFARGTVTLAQMQPLVDSSFQVPPNAMGYAHSRSFTMAQGGQIWGVFGHMHTQGHVITLKSANDCYLDIPSWDFHWQEQYFYATPKQLTAGESLKLECTWNNTTSNMLTFGENTSNEMCVAVLYVTP